MSSEVHKPYFGKENQYRPDVCRIFKDFVPIGNACNSCGVQFAFRLVCNCGQLSFVLKSHHYA